MARRKQIAIDAPASMIEAAALVLEYTTTEHRAVQLAAQYQTAIDRLKAERDGLLAAINEDQKSLFVRLKAWWSVAGNKQLKGKARSIELGGVRIGTRTTTPALKLPKGKSAAEVLDKLLAWLGGDFVRTSHVLDKEAIIARLRREPGADAGDLAIDDFRVLSEELGLTVSQRDEFFIAVAPLETSQLVPQDQFSKE